MDYPRFRSWDDIFKNSGLFFLPTNNDLDSVQRITPETYCNTSDTQSPSESRVNTATYSHASSGRPRKSTQSVQPLREQPLREQPLREQPLREQPVSAQLTQSVNPPSKQKWYKQSQYNSNARLSMSKGGAKTTPNHVSEHNNTPPSKNITYPKKKKMHNKSYRKRRAN